MRRDPMAALARADTRGLRGSCWIRSLAVACLFVLITSCAPPSPDQEKADTIKAAILSNLKDPESAKFSNMRLWLVVLCGEVNAKNSFGGYTGADKFYASENSVTLRSTATRANGDTVELFDKMWQECHDAGNPVK